MGGRRGGSRLGEPDASLWFRLADIATIDDRATHTQQADRERLQRVVADVARRQDSILRQAQDGDDPFARALRGTYNDLEAEKASALVEIAHLDAADETEPSRPRKTDMELLDALPYLALNLADAPEQLIRRLFEITQLTIRLHDDSDQVTVTIKLPADQQPEIAHAAERITQEMPADQADGCVDAVRAPGGA